MPRSSPVWNAFNAGELSPLIDGRTDQDKYFTGCKVLRNFIPTVQGPASRRGGSRYLGSTRNNSRAWFETFEFSQAQSYVLEFTDLKLRFWVNRGLLLSGPDPYEVTTPWSTANLVTEEGTLALRSVQSADVMWIVHNEGAVAPQKLSRLGATNWTIAPAPFDNGPFEDVDPDSTINVTTDAVDGTVTITADSAIFTADDIGTSFYVEQEDGSGVRTWGANKEIHAGDKRRYEGNYYYCVATGAPDGSHPPGTGNAPPVHTDGSYWDGDGITQQPDDDLGALGAEWLYLHSGYGWIKITAIGGGGTTATGDVVLSNGVTQLPDVIADTGTTRWAKSLFSQARGWPTSVAFFRERLCYARGRELAMSVVGSFDDFSRKDGPDITKETAIVLKLAATTTSDTLRWIETFGGRLIGGTASGELSVHEQTTNQVLAADNITHDPETQYGSRLVEPLKAGTSVLFVTRSGEKVREVVVDPSSIDNRLKADDLTVLSDHIVKAGVIDFDLQQEPDSLVWFVLGDGTLAALTYNRERGVIAWVPHVIGGPDAFVETVASIAAPSGRRDDVWIATKRTIDGQTVRYVEVIEDNHLAETDTADAFYGDAGITYEGVSTKTIVGLDHLEGATVQVLADGSAHADCVVTGGSITLTRFATKAQIGFDSPAQLQTMRAESPGAGGSSQTKAKSIAEVWLRLLNSIGGKVGPSFARLDPIPGLNPAAPVGTRPPLFSGDRKTEFPAEYNTDGYICVESSPMLPITVTMIAARMEIND